MNREVHENGVARIALTGEGRAYVVFEPSATGVFAQVCELPADWFEYNSDGSASLHFDKDVSIVIGPPNVPGRDTVIHEIE